MDLSSFGNAEPFIRCAVAFMDCTLFRACADDYDGAPLPLLGIADAVGAFNRATKPLYETLIDLFKAVYDD